MGKGSKRRPIYPKLERKVFEDNWDRIFNQKTKQKSMTELNWDGNEDRGRYGEDETAKNTLSQDPVRQGHSVSSKSSS